MARLFQEPAAAQSIYMKSKGEMMTKYKAFTLAETLITLAVIGVVVAITIPTIITKYQAKVTITKFRKVYSTMTNAYTRATTENGAIQTWKFDDAGELLEMFVPYMRVSEKCYFKKGCINPDVEVVALDLESRWGKIGNMTMYAKLRLNDGTVIFASPTIYPGCTHGNIKDRMCGTIFVFLNQNSPNRMGLDHFNFLITTKGILPYGYNYFDVDVKKACNKSGAVIDGNGNVSNTNGATCGEWIRRFNNIDYWEK